MTDNEANGTLDELIRTVEGEGWGGEEIASLAFGFIIFLEKGKSSYLTKKGGDESEMF